MLLNKCILTTHEFKLVNKFYPRKFSHGKLSMNYKL